MMETTKDRINLSGLTIPPTGVLFGFDSNPAKLLGTTYLDSTWQAGTIKFYGKIAPNVDSLVGGAYSPGFEPTGNRDPSLQIKPFGWLKRPTVRRFYCQ